MTYISNILYWIASGLLVPVIILLILLFLRSLVLLGGFFGQYLAVRKSRHLVTKEFDELNASNLDGLASRLPEKSKAPLVKCIKHIMEVKASKAQVDHLIDEYEQKTNHDLDTSKLLLKMGPMLGLMGTLIPMGPALAGLSSGDIASMAYNMQIAFATTVVGLFASAIGFITKQVKQNWYTKDMNDLDFLSNLIDENK